jgi:DNA-binding XRE family transcriptional regulator
MARTKQPATPLQARREELGLKPVQVAAAAGISLQQVINLEAGKNVPGLGTARSIALALDATLDELWPAQPQAAA